MQNYPAFESRWKTLWHLSNDSGFSQPAIEIENAVSGCDSTSLPPFATMKLAYPDFRKKSNITQPIIAQISIPFLRKIGFYQPPTQTKAIATRVIKVDIAFIGLFKLNFLMEHRARYSTECLGKKITRQTNTQDEQNRHGYFRHNIGSP